MVRQYIELYYKYLSVVYTYNMFSMDDTNLKNLKNLKELKSINNLKDPKNFNNHNLIKDINIDKIKEIMKPEGFIFIK